MHSLKQYLYDAVAAYGAGSPLIVLPRHHHVKRRVDRLSVTLLREIAHPRSLSLKLNRMNVVRDVVSRDKRGKLPILAPANGY